MTLQSPNLINFGDYKKIYYNGYSTTYSGFIDMRLLNSSGALINTARLEMLVGYEREEKDLVPLNIPTTPTPSYMSIYMAAFKNYGATTSTTLTKVWLET